MASIVKEGDGSGHLKVTAGDEGPSISPSAPAIHQFLDPLWLSLSSPSRLTFQTLLIPLINQCRRLDLDDKSFPGKEDHQYTIGFGVLRRDQGFDRGAEEQGSDVTDRLLRRSMTHQNRLVGIDVGDFAAESASHGIVRVQSEQDGHGSAGPHFLSHSLIAWRPGLTCHLVPMAIVTRNILYRRPLDFTSQLPVERTFPFEPASVC
jgi:hypothetical protein